MHHAIVSSARAALLTGLVASAVILLIWLLASPIDGIGLVSFLARWVHILAAVVWVGMIWFVNFIQLAAVEASDEAGRGTLMKHVVPNVALAFRHASHATVASGLVLLVTTGYLFDRWVFTSAVYIPPLKSAMLWCGTLAAALMWAFVHMIIWPSLSKLSGGGEVDPDARAALRMRVRTYARLNLVLAIPVTFVMVAASHLY